MWNLGHRAAVVLICVSCGCLLIYNAWGAILALVLSLLLVVYSCYSLLANDSLVSPQAYHVLVYLREAVLELRAALDSAVGYVSGYVRKLWHSASHYYRERFPLRMDRRRGRGKSYQLSSDSYDAALTRTRDSLTPMLSSPAGRFNPIDQLSQMRYNAYRTTGNNDTSYHRFCQTSDHERSQQLILGKHTSTPVLRPGDRGDPRNGDISLFPSKRTSPLCAQSHTLSRGENATQFSPDGSPWGTSISPKMRVRPTGTKTVQTVAGPLLASTRYNIDPKVYTDVSSPGLTTRLTKYATEAQNKLTHQSHYGTGQLPKVNLHANPVPMLSMKSNKMRMPVTVRLAPPETARYSPPERQRLLSNIRHAPNNNKSPTSVVQVLREISLKRHASREDVTFDVAKKQRTEDLFDEETEMVLEETKQKRARDDSRSEEELSPQNVSIRPAKKRTKTRSCYDILNSLSSSVHVSSGVKRKAIDFSRSGTPDFEKHFKSLKSTQSNSSSSPNLPQSQNLDISHSRRPDIKEIYSRSPETLTCDKVRETLLTKGILKTSNNESRISLNKPAAQKNAKNVEIVDGTGTVSKSVKLTDKLFMRNEPERNEWLQLLAEEQGSVKAKFTKNNVEEIKRDDIRNMRQTSMKARLQSMFDAISGIAESKINPDVVIQADDVDAVAPVVVVTSSAGSRASLNSSTTTTTVNTTPISTAAIVPGGTLTSKPDTKSATAFSLPSPASSAQSNALTGAKGGAGSTTTTTTTSGGLVGRTKVATTTAAASTASSQKDSPSTLSTTPAPPTFVFGKPIAETPAVTTSPTSSSFSAHSSVSDSFPVTLSTTATTSAVVVAATPALSAFTSFLGADKPPSSSAFAFASSAGSTPSSGKAETTSSSVISTTHTSANTSPFTAANTHQASPAFTFGTSRLAAAPTQTSASSLPSQFTGATPLLTTSVIATSNAGFNGVASNGTTSSSIGATTISAPTPLFSFGGTASQTPKLSGMFALGQTNANAKSAFSSQVAGSQATLPLLDTSKSFSFTPTTSPAATTANSSFGVTAAITTAVQPTFGLPSAATFSMGTSAAPAANKPLFVFGANSISSSNNATITPVTSAVFGAMSGNNAVPAFGTSSTTAATPQFGPPATTVPQFGVAANSAPRFGPPTTSSAPQFGSASTTMFGTATPATTAPSIFGTSGGNSQPVFGASTSTSTANTSSMFSSPKTTAASIFAATTSASDGNLFSGNAASGGSTTTSSVFGHVASPVFGQTKPATSFGNTGVFGNTSTTPLFGSTHTTSASTFGIANVASTSGAITSAFVDANSATSAFGTAAPTNAPPNTSVVPAFGGTGGMFGSTDNASVPLFGSNASQPASGSGDSAFASTASTGGFGAQNSPNLTFSAPGTGGVTAASGLAFGTTSSTSAGFGGSSMPGFGADSNAASNSSNMFFGSNQKDGQQQGTGFGFASGNFNNAAPGNSTTAAPAPFQFGSTTTRTGTGFNFTASPLLTINFGTPGTPTFNPSTPGMFSIGSGSTAPRSRAIRTRKPR